ncbi:restriction endonuclease subunit S [Aureispira sp. CCB-E]|uniref:restriction endonuclease subunit S n=1 Tax=Aureispira sp. CCB-E TaxID=3051121 RepID=UPI0028690CDD|nr:restriction endonuclease subunit S [Aureispira sp. CCB-E]WMX17025.1 restriction endonuclease subunit S [Aureispira sp. CCB-E]
MELIETEFKQTEVGLIPVDWEVFVLSDVLNGIADVDHYMPQSRKDGIPYVMTGNLKELASNINFNDCKKISADDYKRLSKKIKNLKGDVILARYATIGTVSYVDIDFDFVVSYSCVTVKSNPSKLLGMFLFYYFKSSVFEIEVKNKVNANTQSNVGIGDLNTMKIALPTLQEQDIIVKALSDVDALIHSLETLIAKKKAIKQGAMQELLTGKTRLVGFENDKGYQQTEVGLIPVDWEVRLASDIAEVRSGKRLPKGNALQDTETSQPYIRVADMFNGGVELKNIKYVPESVSLQISNYRIYKDDIFISVAGTLGICGMIPLILDGANLTENANRFTNIQCDKKFLLYILLSPLIQNLINSSKTLGAQPKLALVRIRNFAIPLPPTLKEQRAIAETLSNMDQEIQTLQTKKEKYQAIKQGMMQELLTGKTRLISS